jgi:cellulose synthase (UDP-forming)
MEAAALAASWFGVLSDVRGVHFPVTVGELPNGNALVFALRGSSLFADLSLPAAAGPLLAMRDNPRDPYGKLLIVTGDRPADLLAAARGLARGSEMPHAGSLSVGGVAVSAAPAYSAPRWLQADEPFPIGTYTTSEHLKLQGTGSITLYFRLPPDLFLRAEDSVPLLLKYEYAGVPEGSKAVLHVRLNGKDIDSIGLKPALTQVKRSAIFRLPTGSLETYTNTLTVDFYFARDAPPANVQPSFAIDPDSSLDLRGIPHSVVVPRLELFADAGYPFTEWPDLGRTGVIMPESPSPADYEALLDMTGFFGAQTGALANALAVAGPHQLGAVQDKDLVLIGAPDSQPLLTEWANNMPLDLSGPEMRINQGFASTIQGAASTWLLHPEWPFRDSDNGRLASLLNNGAGIDAMVESFVSPLHPDRLAVALVPRGPDAPEALRALFTPSERRGPVYGGVVVSQNGRFASFLVGTLAFHAGQFDRYQYTVVFVLEHYLFIPLAVVLFAIMIVAWVRKKTERVAARRLAMR